MDDEAQVETMEWERAMFCGSGTPALAESDDEFRLSVSSHDDGPCGSWMSFYALL